MEKHRYVGKTKEEAINIANEHLDDFKKIALDTIKGNLYNHNISFNLLDKYIK